tara:strand:+ start:1023 stop:1226 length:204 start_codon:yes stop_codon:yes gene_type:complete
MMQLISLKERALCPLFSASTNCSSFKKYKSYCLKGVPNFFYKNKKKTVKHLDIKTVLMYLCPPVFWE